MKSRSSPAIAALLGGTLLVLSGCAAPRPTALADSQETNLEQCDQITGSRIRADSRNDCEPMSQPFRRYSAEELQSTGETDLAEALRQLDPAFH